MRTLAEITHKFRWLIIALWMCLAGALGYIAATGTRFTPDYRVYFAPDNPELVAYDAMQQTYAGDDNIFIGIHTTEGDVFTPAILSLIEELTEQSWQIPHSQRVDSITNYQHIRAEEDEIVISSLVEYVDDLSEADIHRIRTIALSESVLQGKLLSEDGKTTGIFVTLNFPGTDHREHVPETINYVRDMMAKIEPAYPDLKFVLSGTAVISYALDEMTVQDLSQLGPILFVILLALIWGLLRSFKYSLVIGLVIALSAIGAMGLAAATGITLTTASVIAPVIILTLAVADAVHFIASVRESGQVGVNAVARALEVNFKPITLTSLTTLIGFLSLNFSASPPFRDLGNISAMGVGLAWMISVTLVPALCSLVKVKSAQVSLFQNWDWDKFADMVIVRRKVILALSGLSALICLALVPLNRLDDRVVEWFGPSTQIRQDVDFLTETLTGPYRMDFSLYVQEGEAISSPAYMRDVDAFASWLRGQPGVLHVDALSDVMRRLNRAMNAGNDAYFNLPDSNEAGAQYLLLYEMSLPYGLDLTTQMTFDKTASRVTATLANVSSAETRALKARAEEWVRQNLQHATSSQGTGTMVMFAFVSKHTINSMLYGTGLAFVLISATLLITLKSVRLGILSLVPNILPVLVTFGLWALTVGQIGVVASSIAATTLGLVVDDTVHFLAKYHKGRYRHRLSVHDGIRLAFRQTGPAMLTTTIVLVAGFSVLMLSDFLINWQMGVLTAVTVAVALALDFLLLPTLLMLFDKDAFCPCKTCTCEDEDHIHTGQFQSNRSV